MAIESQEYFREVSKTVLTDRLEAKRVQIAMAVLSLPIGSPDRLRAIKCHRLLTDLIERNGGTPEDRAYVMQQLNG